MIKLLLVISVLPIFSFAQTIGLRQYKPGEVTRYKLTTEAYRNDKLAGTSISISQHKVITDSGILSEEISWLGKSYFTASDTTRLDTVARRVMPYRISLSPNGKVLLPQLAIAEMTGDITDLNTFFVAIAPALNAQKLSPTSPVVVNDKPRKGDFADGARILSGTDCIEVTQHLVNTTKEYSIIKTDFNPPAAFCLDPLLDTITKKTFDSQNNFQMIQKGTGDKVNVFWGVESFSITTRLDNKTGQIIEASMVNLLNLRMRYNTSKDMKTYDLEMPVSIKRNVKLELIKE